MPCPKLCPDKRDVTEETLQGKQNERSFQTALAELSVFQEHGGCFTSNNFSVWTWTVWAYQLIIEELRTLISIRSSLVLSVCLDTWKLLCLACKWFSVWTFLSFSCFVSLVKHLIDSCVFSSLFVFVFVFFLLNVQPGLFMFIWARESASVGFVC